METSAFVQPRTSPLNELRRDVLLELHAGDLARVRELEVRRRAPGGPEARLQELREIRPCIVNSC